ncbi:MAG TPA: pyridoxal-phosphate dependent enzyme [Acidimicrobiia bacterium]
MSRIDLDSGNPFIRYRRFLDSFGRAAAGGWSDADFVSLVRRLDEAVRAVDGRGFMLTPMSAHPEAAQALGLATDRLWVKDDTHNVGGSHKARHLFGVMLHLALDIDDGDSELAIASCGNAALAAAVVARAEERPLRVFIPTWADRSIVAELERLDARIEVCERRPGEAGDPTYLRFLEAIDRGAVAFSVQSTVTPTTIDGGRTLGWEAAEQLGGRSVEGPMRVMVQVGGGAMATAVASGIETGVFHDWVRIEPRYHPVQTEACAPFRRAWDGLLHAAGVDRSMGDEERAVAVATDAGALAVAMSLARNQPDRFMYAWGHVGETAASGIVDDVTYDWLGVIEPTLRSGGWPVVVDEAAVLEAHRIAHEIARLDPSATGTAGLAGLLEQGVRSTIGPEEQVLAFVTGIER